MATASGLTIGPMSVDSAGDLVARLGVHNQADRLLNRHRQMYPLALVQALSRPRDAARSAALDKDEVLEALQSLRGKRAFFKDEYVLEDAAVKGDREDNRVVSVVYTTPSGRSGRGVIPYADLPASQRAYEDALAKEEGRVADRPVEAASTEAADAAHEEQLRTLELQLRQSREAQEAVLERLARLEDPEPFGDYDERNADALIDVIKGGGVEEFGRAGLERMLDYEERHKDRKGVKDAIGVELEKPSQQG